MFSVTDDNNVEAMNSEGLVQFKATNTRNFRFYSFFKFIINGYWLPLKDDSKDYTEIMKFLD